MAVGTMKMMVVVVVAMAMVMKGMAAKTYTVGDDNGWILPTSPGMYADWLKGKTFQVGDILVFNFAPTSHSVAMTTSKDSYDKCDPKGAKVITIGPTEVTLTETGEVYFFCTIGSHCDNGQRFAIDVVDAAPGPSSADGPANSPASSPDSDSPPDTLSPPKDSSSHLLGLSMSTLCVSFVALVATLLH